MKIDESFLSFRCLHRYENLPAFRFQFCQVAKVTTPVKLNYLCHVPINLLTSLWEAL